MNRLPLFCALLYVASAAAATAGDALADRVAHLTKDFKGTIAIYAKNLDTGRDFGLRPDDKVRTASTVKLPILCALESLVAAGAVRWNEPITIRTADQVSGSGVVGDLGDGTVLPLRDLAVLMIVVSDNTATNLILDRITADAVNDYLDTLGLTATRSLRKIRRDSTPPTGWSRAGRLPENEKYGLGVSTSREMVRLLELLYQGKVVSADASKDVLAIMKRQQDKAGIGRHAADDVASKSGALDALRSDVGIVRSKGGPIAMAITVDGMPEVDYSPDNAGSRLIWELSKVLVDGLAH